MVELPNPEEAIRRGYLSRPEQLMENEEAVIRTGDGGTLACQKIALPNGLAATVTWDRCMDVSRLSYRGIPIAYQAKGGEKADGSLPFSQRFPGGMLCTCGLINVGPGDAEQPAHGRVHLQAATLRGVTLTDTALELRGEMREAALFGENLLLRRTLTFPLSHAEVRLRDTVINQSPKTQPYMLLYHINLGYPFLSEHLRLSLPPGTHTVPATDTALAHQDELARFSAPDPDFEEQDFLHRLPAPGGESRLSADNAELGIRFSLRYRADALPMLNEWRCLRSGDYALALEPTNCRVNGRAQAQAEGSLPVLAPFASVTTELSFSLESLS